KDILLIGAGEMGIETLKYLQDYGAKKISITNRNASRAEEVAKGFQAKTTPWEDIYRNVLQSDLVVSTTGAPEPIVRTQELKAARTQHPSRAVLILDLAVPRDFESEISDLPDTYLYTVDDLHEVCERNIQARKAQWPKAQQIVDEETKKFLAETKHRGGGGTIKQLRDQALEVKEVELDRLLQKLDKSNLDETSKKEIEVAFDRLVNKLLHPPMQSLRENADSSQHASLLEALRRLFQLKD
ncbi:MAG: glutamyl-tRNA reductase, partial [Planctomycetota bacterium]